MAKKRDMSYHKYFTKVQLAKAFGYANAASFMSSRASGPMWEGIMFVVKRVEQVKEQEIKEKL